MVLRKIRYRHGGGKSGYFPRTKIFITRVNFTSETSNRGFQILEAVDVTGQLVEALRVGPEASLENLNLASAIVRKVDYAVFGQKKLKFAILRHVRGRIFHLKKSSI